jgi:hypothetical protein
LPGVTVDQLLHLAISFCCPDWIIPRSSILYRQSATRLSVKDDTRILYDYGVDFKVAARNDFPRASPSV